ncbi:MAG: amidase family protein [Gemmatimonadota bacterium]|nr:amidase family protein [Gemmatimonadota bacterium]
MSNPLRTARLTLVAVLVTVGCSQTEAPSRASEAYSVAEVPMSRISEDLAAGRTTSVEVTQAYIERIRTMDEPLNSVIMVAPDALEQAASSDARRAAGRGLGPLDGVPILLKDNIDAVGMPTTAGSFALVENQPVEDSEVVRRLRGAGVVLLGKANLSQFAGFRNTASFNGSTVGGSPHNPYDLSRSPAGSSSGSGIAAAMSFAAATIGTETGGSIVGPSSVNGIVGMKPTIALVSRRGIVPISLNQDSSGPMTRTVRDAAMILGVIAGTDPGDPWSEDADQHVESYVAALDDEALRGARVGVLRPTGESAEETEPLFDAALDVLSAEGAELVEIAADALVDPRPEMRIILLQDFKVDLDAYLETVPSEVPVRSLAELIEFSRNDPRELMHSMDYWEDAQATEGGRSDPGYQAALADGRRLTRDEGIDRLLAEYDVDVLVSPTGTPASEIEPDGTPRAGPIPKGPRGTRPPSLTVVAAVAGYPLISVPMGLVDGLPVGITFAGTAWSEASLLGYAYDYEQASLARVPPPRAMAGGSSDR